MLTKNQRAEVRIESCTPEGYGVCRLEGRAVFVASAMSGERWEILILKVTASAVWAKGLRLLETSPCRCEPYCPNLCGGCTLRHMRYEEELRVKKEHVDDCLHRLGKQAVGTAVIHPSPLTERYRNKAIFAVDTVAGKPAFGFYRPRTHTLVPVRDCLLQSEKCLRAARAVVDFMELQGVPAYTELTGKGTVRHLFWRESRGGDAVLCIVAARGFGSLTSALTVFLREQCPFLTGIVLNINKTRGNTVLAGEFYTLWGRPTVKETLCGNEFEVAPQAFLQINPPQAEALYRKALEYATENSAGEPAGNTLALDLYCGAGTVSLCLAARFRKVIGAEIVPQAIENAKENAERNGIENAEFVCADAAEIADRLKREGTAIAAVSAVLGALRFVKKDLKTAKIVMNGCGAAGTAIGRLLVEMGAENLIMAGRNDTLYEGCHWGKPLDRIQEMLCKTTNKKKISGKLKDVAVGADVLIGASSPGVFTEEIIKSMAPDSIVFSLANPVPEAMYDFAKAAGARVAGTGRSDAPNQVNNVNVFPGVFRGAIDVRATEINEEMKIAATYAIANLIDEKDLREDYVVPNAFDKRVGPAVAAAVAKAAIETGVARKIVDPEEVRKHTEELLADYWK